MDFTLKLYQSLLIALKQADYEFITFEEFCSFRSLSKAEKRKFIILRHDVDKMPKNALRFAQMENELSIQSSYFFLTKKTVFQQNIITQIHNLGHEIGYHYQDFVAAKGDSEKAIDLFQKNLSLLRAVVPVKTICMHGSPTSKIDNKDIWKSYNYRDFNIIGEPYFDVNFNEIFYLTDTGRTWNGERFSVRDKVKSVFNLHFNTTNDIINAVNSGILPNKIMITTHPQRWTDKSFAWLAELVLQTAKNLIKSFIVKK